MSLYHAVYLEKNPATENDIPAAFFLDEQAALDWAYEKALVSVDIIDVDIIEVKRHKTGAQDGCIR